MSENDKKKNFGNRVGEVIGMFIMLALLLFFFKAIAWGYDSISPFYGYSQKSELDKNLSKAIMNKADLSAIKTIFNNRNINRSFLTRVFSDSSDSYIEPISLNIVLSDMRAQYYLQEAQEGKYLDLLNEVIKENREVNPFDKLLEHQKDRFDNIRVKLDSQYSMVENDVVKISDELNKQNELVREYLSDSTTSLIISITGLAFALIISLVQIFQSKKKQKSDNQIHSNYREKIESIENNLRKL